MVMRLHHEEELDEQDRKGDQARQERHHHLVACVPAASGNGSWDAGDPRRCFPPRTPKKANVRAEIHERQLNGQPQKRECDKGGKGHGSTGGLSPDEEVEDEEQAENQPGHQEGSLKSCQ